MKTTNWQVRLNKNLSELVREKAKTENRSINKTILLILELYFNLKEEDKIITDVNIEACLDQVNK